MSSQTTVVIPPAKAPATYAGKYKETRLKKYVKRAKGAKGQLMAAKRGTDMLKLPPGWGQTIMPERFVTTVRTSLQFYIPAAGIDALNGNYTNFKINSIVQPWNTTYSVTAIAPVFSMNGSFVQGFGLGTQPIGSAFLNNAYEKYKVLGYKVKVSIMTGLATDIVEAVLLPLGLDEIPSSTSSNVNCNVFKGQPKSRFKICHNGGPNNVLNMKGSVYELLGQRKSQWMDTPSTNIGSNPDQLGYAGLFVQSLTGTTNAQPIVFDITLFQIVEFTDLNNANFLS